MREQYKKVMFELDVFYQVTIERKFPKLPLEGISRLGISKKGSESIINKISKYN